MNDKLQKLYDLYVQSGLIKTTDFKTFSSSNEQQIKKLYDLGKQSGLIKTTDYNTFNSTFNVNPSAKKKSTTGSQSVQPKKSTSSVTPVSWMQESLVSSSSQGQKKTTTSTTTKYVAPKKETAVEQVIPGKEQTRMNNGRLERLYNGIWVDAASGGREVGELSKSIQQSRKEDENIFTGYPGKEKNEYRVYNNVWQRRQPGKTEWTTIINGDSINALNKQFNQEVKVGSNINVQLRSDAERKELDNRLATVNSKLIDKEEDEVIKELKRRFPNFKFIEQGTFTDEVLVESPDGKNTISISLDNWTFDDDRNQAADLREFIRKNSNNDLNEADKNLRKAEKDMEYFTVKPFYPTIQIGDGYGDEKIVTDPSQISTEPKQKMSIITADQNLKAATKEYVKQSENAFLDVQERARISAQTNGKLDDREVVAAYAALDHDARTARAADRYFQDVSAQSKDLKKQFNEYSLWVDNINEKAKSGEISKEEYESTYVPQMKAELDRLKGMSDKLNDEYSTSNNMLKSIEKATAENYVIQESKGSVAGGLAYNFTKGLTDIARIATFGNFDAKDQEAIVRLIVGGGTTEEYMSSENRNDLTKVLFSLATSLGQAASGGIIGRSVAAIGGGTKTVLAAEALPFYSGGYYEMKDQFDDPKFKNVSDFEKVMYSTLYGVASGVLEKYGLTKSISKTPFGKSLTSSILSSTIKQLPKDATEQMIKDAVESSVLNRLKSAGVNTLGAFVVEASTESAQKVTELALQETFDWIHGNNDFKNGTWKDMFVNTLYEGYLGGLGGGMMQIASSSISGITDGLTKTLNKDQIQVLDNMVKIDGMADSYDSYLKGMVVNGDITPDEAREMSTSFREVKGNFDKIPDNIAPEEKAKAFDLMIERSKIEKEIMGKDESLVAPQKARIAEINNELKTISEDATKKSTEQQQEVTAEGGGIQREGVVEGQQEVGQGEGPVGQATEQGADLGNRPVEGRSQEEIDARVSELETMLADDAATLEETGTGTLLPEAKTEIQSELESLKAEVPVEVKAETAVPKIAETTDTKTYSEALSSAKAELKAEGKGLDLQVSDVSQEEADAIVKEGGKIFMTEDGLAGAYVKKDGYMGGLFKSPKATYKNVAKLLQQARIKVGGRFMDAYATELERIYTENGFRPVARLKFNEEYAPEGWDAPGSALASKPDVVFFAYDPEGKYKIGDGEYVTDYDAAYEMAKNFDAKTANEADRLAAILEKKATVSDDVISREEINKRISLAQKALKIILPDVKFVVHDTNEAFIKATGDLSAGAYDPDTKTIHINAKGANRRTVSHEVFHAIIISKVASDVQLQKLTANMVNSVLKSLKQTGTNQDVIDYLEKFAAGYKNDPTVMNEERLAELHGILGENMIELPLPTQNIIKRFLDRLAKMFGLKEMTDREAVEFMNTMSSKVEAGKEITAKEFKGGTKVSKPSDGLTTRKQYGNDKVKVEVRYLEQERMDELIKNGLVQEVNNLSALNGQRVVTTSPDDMLVGSIYVNGKEVAVGNGGIFFVTKFGDVWANSNEGTTRNIASAINESSKANGGKAYLVLVKGSDAKLVSSPQGVTSSLAVTESMLDAGLFSLSDFRSAIRSAVKDAGGTISLSQNGSAKTLKNELDSFFSDVTASTFEKRGNVLKAIIANLAKSESASKNKAEIIKFLNGDTSKGLGVGVTPKSQSLVDLVAKVSAEELTKGLNVGDIYGVIEINGEVDVFQDKHQSYPYHIKMIDKDGNVSSEKPVLILPKNRKNGKEILTSVDGQTSEDLGSGFAGKVGGTANLPYGKGIIQDSTAEVENKSNIRQQKPLTTDKDVHPGYETALNALGETEAQIEQWRSENRVNQRQKRNPIVEKAAKDYYNEEITQEEYLDIVSKNQPIKPFKKVPALPTLKEVVNSLDKNKVEKGIVGLTKNINDGERVASRLDIPAYETYDTWVVSVHDGVKEGKSIAYGQTAVLNNVEFKSFSGPAIKMAMGVQNKTPIARMFGNWVNEDPESVHARAKELMNDPEWVQVGMNPFRHSWFYDKSDGMPLASAEEVVQVGALVLAKNPVKVAPSDPMFETKSSKGGKIRFQKPLEPEAAEKLTEDGKGNYVFNHYSDKKRDVIKPGTGQNNITSREEANALSAVNGLAQYYTMDMQKEPGTGPSQHTILIPKDRVYYFNKDQEGFYDEAKRRFEKVRPGQAFNSNYQVAFITQVANDNGYDMVVANWRNGELRAQTTMELTPSDKIINFKPLKEVKYEVGDTVEVYGSKAKITDIDGTILTFKGEGIGGTIDFKRSPKSIQKIATPKEQVEEEVKSLDKEVDTEKPKFRKQKPSDQAAVIVKTGKEAGLSDAGIREYMKRNGYTDRQATDAIQAYNDKQEGIFIDPNWSKLRKAAVIFKRRFLSSRGLMPSSAFASYEQSQANTAKDFNKAEKIIADFNRAINKVPKVDKDKVRKDFDEYVRGDKSISLPLDLKKSADAMRAHIDSISISLINSGVVDEHLAQKIKDNLGSYFTRSYRVHDRANWKNEVEENIKQKAINLLKIQYMEMAKEKAAKENMDVQEALDNLVTNALNDMLTKSGAENFVSGGKKGSKDLSILKERQDIPLEIRMLMGEYTDPAQNYARTILKMSALAANHQFLTEVKKNGTGVFLFEKNDPRRPKNFDYEIAAEGSETMNPLNGMYTTKEIGKQFEEQSSQLKGVLKWTLETYMRLLSSVKWGKTIGSLMTHAKNVFGNIGFVLVNGHWRVNEMGRAYKTVKNDLFSKDKAGLRDYMNKLIELGIVKQSAGIGELRAMFKDADWDTAMIERINKNTGSKWDWVKSKFSKGAKFMEDMYQAEDDFFKIVAYENELSRYSKAMFGKSKNELTEEERAEVDKVVAEIVKNTYPTYSRIPELVNMIRRLPFIGNFISFQAESYRTAFNTAALSLDEIKSENPGVRQIGAQRLVGSITYMSAKTAILSAFSNAVGMGAVGILGYFTDDEDEKQKEDDVRKFLPEWSKNSDLLMLKASDGKIKYVDFSSSDPHGGINKAINSLLIGEKSVDGLINAMGSIIEPFIGEEMTTAAILAVKTNKNAYGKPIYNPEDTFYEKFKDISAHMLNTVQPGTVSTIRRATESEGLVNELVGASTGMRIYEIDVAEKFGYSMITYGKRIEDAKRIYNSEVYSKDATKESISDAKKRAEKAITNINKQIHGDYYSALRLGANEDVLFDNLKRFGRMSLIDMKFMFGEVPYLLKEKFAEEE